MSHDRSSASGFSLVEVIIAMFILGMIALALLPALIQGLQYSTQQSAVATATRQLNALIEVARDAQTCAALNGLAPASYRGGVKVATGSTDFTVDDNGFMCSPGSLNTITLTATGEAGVLATVSAKVWANS